MIQAYFPIILHTLGCELGFKDLGTASRRIGAQVGSSHANVHSVVAASVNQRFQGAEHINIEDGQWGVGKNHHLNPAWFKVCDEI